MYLVDLFLPLIISNTFVIAKKRLQTLRLIIVVDVMYIFIFKDDFYIGSYLNDPNQIKSNKMMKTLIVKAFF